jgi:molybdate transport system substrate-binding protein
LFSHRCRLLLLGLATVTAGCEPSAPELPKLRVAVASDLEQALPILASAFQQDHQIEIVPTFGASGQLAEQIKQGAPFDVFMSANAAFVDRLASTGIIKPESVHPYARGSLALAVNKIWDFKVKRLEDLTTPEIQKIAIANPETAPYGMAAKQALERAKLWDVLKPKIVQAESVRQALQFVQSGNTEVAIVGRSLGQIRGATLVPLPFDVCDPIVQSLGIVARSERPDDAKAFADFVRGEIGQGILRDLGFRKVEKASHKPQEKDEPKGSP